MKTVISGVQPTGYPTLGHLLGTVHRWQSLQKDHACIFFVADLHAITLEQNPAELTQRSLELVAFFLAAGVDPEHSLITIQSQLPQHSELAWILNCQTATGELSRMTQFKDKSESKDHVYFGLYAYPVLMAADILLYQADYVPVGADQKQHLELARLLAKRFNHKFGQTFVVPEPMIASTGSRVMSLQDPTKKMSKSDVNTNNYISIMDSKEMIVKKIKRAVTDSEGVVRVDDSRPGISNLIEIYSMITNEDVVSIEQRYQGKGYGAFKSDLAEIVVAYIEPIANQMNAYLQNPNDLKHLLKKMRAKAMVKADETLNQVKKAVGLLT